MHIRGSSIYFAVIGLTSTTAVLAAVQPYGQCGGVNHQGETTCVDGWTCTKTNDWYSQCVEGQNGGGNAPTSTTDTTTVVTEPSAAPVPSNNVTSVIVESSAVPVPSSNATEPVVVPSTLETVIATPTLTPVTEATSSAVLVASSALASAAPSSSSSPSTGGSGKNGADCSLDAAFKAHGKKYIGVATDQGRLAAGDNAQIIEANFGQVTPENRYVSEISLLLLLLLIFLVDLPLL